MITSSGNLVISDEPAKIDLIRVQYEAIAEHCPPNSDRDFIRAKRDLALKGSRKPTLTFTPRQLFDEAEQEKIIESIALGSRAIVDILLGLRDTNSELYLGDGLIRNGLGLFAWLCIAHASR
jgi:hypothetical protein